MVLSEREQTRGWKLSSTMYAALNLGPLLMEKGDREEAENLLIKVYRNRSEVFPDHPRTIEAAEILEMKSRTLGKDHPETKKIERELGMI